MPSDHDHAITTIAATLGGTVVSRTFKIYPDHFVNQDNKAGPRRQPTTKAPDPKQDQPGGASSAGPPNTQLDLTKERSASAMHPLRTASAAARRHPEASTQSVCRNSTRRPARAEERCSMTATTTEDRCSSRGCKLTLTGRGYITDRDGHKYCRKHGDRLPAYLRRARHTKTTKAAT